MKANTTILDLKIGEFANIASFTSDTVSDKMLEMGAIPGSKIKFLLAAPMGDPLLIQVDDCQLTIRREEAISIIIKK